MLPPYSDFNFREYKPYYLHSNYSIDEEQHGYQECNIRKSLGGKNTEWVFELHALLKHSYTPRPN